MDIYFTLIPQEGYIGYYSVRAYKQSSEFVEVAAVIVGPMDGTDTPVNDFLVVPTTEPYIIRVFGCGTTLVSQFNVNTPLACPLPGDPVMSALTTTTGTFTWTAATPTPANGYDWKLILVHTFDDTETVQSGNTAALTVSLTGLLPGTNYIFRIRSFCGDLSLSAAVDLTFSTPAAPVPKGEVRVFSNLVSYGFVIVRSTTSLINYYCQVTHDLPYDQYEIVAYDFDGSGCSGTRSITPAVGTLFSLDAAHLVFNINIACT